MNTEPRIERTRKPARCPSCGHKPVASIVYGMPMEDPERDPEVIAGRIMFGGCCVEDDDPPWACSRCGQVIYRKRRQQRSHTAAVEWLAREIGPQRRS